MDDLLKEGDVAKFSKQGISYCIHKLWVQGRAAKFTLRPDVTRAIAAVRFQVTEPLYGIADSLDAYVCKLIADPYGWYPVYRVGNPVGAWSREYLTHDVGVTTQTRRLTVKVATPEGDRDG